MFNCHWNYPAVYAQQRTDDAITAVLVSPNYVFNHTLSSENRTKRHIAYPVKGYLAIAIN